jgi:pyruvate dehydrogenase E2 component (dihydrolipoamide acetyltransferase)
VSLGEAIEKGIAKKGTKPAPKDPTPEPEGDDPGADLEGLKRPELEKLAKGLGIDLDALEGTGKDGNVVNNDVKDAIVKARAKQAESAENKQRKTAKNKGV